MFREKHRTPTTGGGRHRPCDEYIPRWATARSGWRCRHRARGKLESRLPKSRRLRKSLATRGCVRTDSKVHVVASRAYFDKLSTTLGFCGEAISLSQMGDCFVGKSKCPPRNDIPRLLTSLKGESIHQLVLTNPFRGRNGFQNQRQLS